MIVALFATRWTEAEQGGKGSEEGGDRREDSSRCVVGFAMRAVPCAAWEREVSRIVPCGNVI